MTLRAVFHDVIRLEIELWDAVDRRLQGECGLPLAHFEPMAVIDRLVACRVQDIAADLAITTGGASKLVDRVESQGLCRRRPHPGDRRSSLVELTPAGNAALERAGAVLDDELDRRLGRVLAGPALDQVGALLVELRAAARSGGEGPLRP